MKSIEVLSEVEIRNLTDEDVELMIKLKKAEEGIKLIEKPKMPNYFPIKQPDKMVYTCGMFGDDLVLENIDELNKIIAIVSNSTSAFKVEYNWEKLGSEFKYATKELKHSYNEKWNTITQQNVYSIELYSEISDLAAQNKKLKDAYEKELKEYESIINESLWIEDEIKGKVREVREKFWKLDDYCGKFKYDYLPLSKDDKEVAINFMDKAYRLSEEEKSYILENYENLQ